MKTGSKSTMPSGWARAVCPAARRSRSFFAGTGRADPHQSPSFDPCSNPALGRCSSQAHGDLAQAQKRSDRGCTRRDLDGRPSRAFQWTAGITRRIVTPEILGQQARSAQVEGVATARSLPDTHLGRCSSSAHGGLAQGRQRSDRGRTRRDLGGRPWRALQWTAGTTRRLITGPAPRHASRRGEENQHPSLECGTSSELGRGVSPAHGSLALAYIRPNSRCTRRDMGGRVRCTGKRQPRYARRFVACAVPLRALRRPLSPSFLFIDLRSDPALGRRTPRSHRLLAHVDERPSHGIPRRHLGRDRALPRPSPSARSFLARPTAQPAQTYRVCAGPR